MSPEPLLARVSSHFTLCFASPTSVGFPLTRTGCARPDGRARPKTSLVADATNGFTHGRVPKGTSSISLNAKIITTDTAEIIGAARAEFKADDTVRQLVAKPAVTTDEGQSESASPSARPGLFGDLQAKVQSVKLAPGDFSPGEALVTMSIANTSETKTYGVAISGQNYRYNFQLSNSRNEEFACSGLSGINNMSKYEGSLTDIPPKRSITITARCEVRWTGRPGDYRPYTLQTVILFAEEAQGRYGQLKQHNLVLEVK